MTVRDIFRIEERSLNAWPALSTDLYDGWLLRSAAGYSKRANSVSSLYPGRLPAERKIDYCEGFYAARGLPAVFKLTQAEPHREIDERLSRRGYNRIDETVVQTLDLDHLERRGDEGVTLEERFTDTWIDAFCTLDPGKAPFREVIASLLALVDGPLVVASVRDESGIVACGYGAVEEGWIGLFDILVEPGRRRTGIGRRLVTELLARARELGCGNAYLQVVDGNLPALALYESIGFREAYRYWYRKQNMNEK